MKKLEKDFNKLSITKSNVRSKSNQKKTTYNKVGYVYDEFMLKHKAKRDHCECPERIQEIYSNLIEFRKKECLEESLISINSSQIDSKILEKYVGVEYIKKLKLTEKLDCDEDSDTFFNEFTYNASLLSAGCLINLTKSVINKNVKSGFAITRPPGHHSDNTKYTGFCFLNNVYIAARYCIDYLNIKKVAIVDWDVHFGDGTYELLKSDPNIFFVSLHKHNDGNFYPGTGNKEKIGENEGKHFKLNIPWNTGSEDFLYSGMKISDDEYYQAFNTLIIPILEEFKPEVIFVSSGFDAAEKDPLGGLDLTPIGYSYMTSQLMKICDKVIVALEGGYNLNSLKRCSESIIKTLLGYDNPFKGLLIHNKNAFLNDIPLNELDDIYYVRNDKIFKFLMELRAEFSVKWNNLKLNYTPKDVKYLENKDWLKLINSNELNSLTKFSCYNELFSKFYFKDLNENLTGYINNKLAQNTELKKEFTSNLEYDNYLTEYIEIGIGYINFNYKKTEIKSPQVVYDKYSKVSNKSNTSNLNHSSVDWEKRFYLKAINESIRTTQSKFGFNVIRLLSSKNCSNTQQLKNEFQFLNEYCVNDLSTFMSNKLDYIDSFIEQVNLLKNTISLKLVDFYSSKILVFFKNSNQVILSLTRIGFIENFSDKTAKENSKNFINGLSSLVTILNTIKNNEEIEEDVKNKGGCNIF